MNTALRLSLAASACLLSLEAWADVRLPSVISDHMVVQADTAVPLWGWAAPGEEVTVSLAGQTATAKADDKGKWTVKLENLKASDQPQVLSAKGMNTLTVNDVLVGQVWLASGQSNMELKVQRARDYEKEQAAAAHPLLRMYTVTRSAEPGKEEDCGGKWEVCSPETVGNFSAVAYFFGREIQETLKTPVGIVHSSVGGTDIAAWTSLDVQKKVPELKAFLAKWREQDKAYDARQAKEAYKTTLKNWEAAAAKAKEAGKTTPRKPAAPMQPRLNANYPAHLFNGRLAPLIPYAIHGAIWYQGEHNSSTPEEGVRYRKQLPLLINDWRARWGYDFPFAWVQLPGYASSGPGRPFVREAMLQTLRLKNTGMAVTLDIGDAHDNHPKNKQDVGHRLALWALGDVYGSKVPATSGPLLTGQQIRGGEIVVSFSHTEKGLKAHGGVLKGFVIAGEQREWKPATARIDGDKVIVSNPEVTSPVAVRYAWDVSPDCTLFNGAGLPASPFRTDDWAEPKAAAQTDAFPGAEGFGRHALGGRGGKVFEVTNLEDYKHNDKPVPGSLREAVESSGPRVIVFRLSGTIALKQRLDVRQPFLTIAGQTAPGDGICLRDNQLLIVSHDVIVRYLRVRPGVSREVHEMDCISIDDGARDVMVDHCSTSWSNDEGISCNKDVDRVTVQWCIIAENLGRHGFGSIISSKGGGLTYHHNLYISNISRNPRPGGFEDGNGVCLWDFRNNVIYNWGGRLGYNGNYGSHPERTAEEGNLVANCYLAGPSSKMAPLFIHVVKASKMFASGNVINHKPAGWEAMAYQKEASEASVRVNEPFEVAAVHTDSAEDACATVIRDVGARVPRLDAVDLRLLSEVKEGKGALVADPEHIPGWPELKSSPAPGDSDHDGIPDDWEKAHNLDPHNPADGAHFLPDGYTNLDVYLDDLAHQSRIPTIGT